MRLLWIDLNSSYTHASLALPAIHAQIPDDPMVKWTVVSATINENIGTIVENAARYRPDIIAATTWLFNREVLLHVISRLKTLFPAATVILGGPEFLDKNYVFLQSHPYINCVFRGEGEEHFPQWLQVVYDVEQWENIAGLCYFDNRGTYHDNGTAHVQQFDRLKAPESSRFFNWEKPFVQLETARGCFNTCAFCVSGGEKPVRTLPVESIRTRLQNIAAHGIREVRILDRTFNYDAARTQALLALFCEFKDTLRFHVEVHPGLLTDSIKETLRNIPSGLLHIEAGIQSLHEEVLERCERKGDFKNSLEGLTFLCHLPNVKTHADLIAGLPLYRYKDIIEDVHILALIGAEEIQLESLKILPGTVMRNQAVQWGIRYAPLPPYEVLQTDDMSTGELQQARRLSRLLDYYYNCPAWRRITRQLILRECDFIIRFLEYLTDCGAIEKPLSIEKRGLLLYTFCRREYPRHAESVSVAWIQAGMSLKKEPAKGIRTKGLQPPSDWRIIEGEYRENMKLCTLTGTNIQYWFGYDIREKQGVPHMVAITDLQKSPE
ncbi:MAG: DUF4080 domain-containing protein [Coprobacter sp.]|nr:DUF4080 domain-containing protein [Coprobacter sp.]